MTAGLAGVAAIGRGMQGTGTKQAACIETFACGGGGASASPGIRVGSDASGTGGGRSGGGSGGGNGTGGGALGAVVDFGKGVVVDGVWGAVKGIGNAVAHPIDTAAGVGRAIANPKETATAIKDSVAAAWKENPSRALGAIAFEIASLPVAPAKVGTAGKVLSKLDKIDDASNAAKVADAAGAGARRAEQTCSGGVCTNGSCFAAGTPVATPSGDVPIESLVPGELVLARDPETGETSVRPVVQRFVTVDREVFDLGLETAGGSVEHLTVTPEHPFWREGGGWTEASALAPGERVRTASGGELRVVAMRSLPEKIVVYNVEVETAHTYFVGHASAWVHNACTKPTTHAEAAQQYRDAFQRVHGREPTAAEQAAAARGQMDDRVRSALGLGETTVKPSGQVGLSTAADQKILDEIGQRGSAKTETPGPPPAKATGLPQVDKPLAKGDPVNAETYDRFADQLNGKVNVVEKKASLDKIDENVEALRAGQSIPPVEVAPGNPPVIVRGYESYIAGQMAGKPVEIQLVTSAEKGRPTASIGAY